MNLNEIKSPKDLKELDNEQLNNLAQSIREYLIDTVAKTGGHLSSNLGVVELTIALLKAFDMPKDKVVWDVGHQSYIYKILTGRYSQFATLRQQNGISGFPKREESEFDAFNTGHSSTSISAALGLAKARDINGEDFFSIAVIGDGSMTGGLAYEGLNNAGGLGVKKFLIIINDNDMSISPNVGAMSSHLSNLRHKPGYINFKHNVEYKMRARFGKVGAGVIKALKSVKDSFKKLVISANTFEDMGFTYIGTVDGHDIEKLVNVFERIKTIDGPVVLHINTIKGKGYSPAELEPGQFHGIGKFDVLTGEESSDRKETYSDEFGKNLVRLAEQNEKICAITPSMKLGSGLDEFSQMYPKRFFDVGIAESHAVTFAAGLAAGGLKPVVCIYSSFLQRAYDNIIHDVALQNLDVVFCIDRAGAIGADGETHQGLYDISYLNTVPNMTILAPANFYDFKLMLDYAVKEHHGPIAIRYPRGNTQSVTTNKAFELGKAEVLVEGDDLTILCVGKMVSTGIQVARILHENNVYASVVNMRTVKPFDKEIVRESLKTKSLIVTIEDNIADGGFASMLCNYLESENLRAKVLSKAFADGCVKQASDSKQYEEAKMDCFSIAEEILTKYFK